RRFSKRAVLFDMDAAARSSGTIISAVMLGAIAGAQILPVPKRAFEDAVRASGKGAVASLKGFAAGFAAAGANGVSTESGGPKTAGLSNRAVPAAAQDAIARLRGRFPQPLQALIEEGYL